MLRGRVTEDEVLPGIVRLRLSSWHGFEVTPYLVGGLLVDTGFAHVRTLVLEHLAPRRLSAICCTHHHEDHAGNAAALARQHGCPVYLRNPAARFAEGLARLPLYRRLWWGAPEPYAPLPMPQQVRAGDRVLEVIPTPGHSRTHVAFHDARAGAVLSGDLFIAPGATAVMREEDPYALVASLRRVAALNPSVLLTGHGRVLRDARRWLNTKAARVEEAAAQVCALHERGMGTERIVARVFSHGRGRDLGFRAITAGDFSRANFVRAAIACRS